MYGVHFDVHHFSHNVRVTGFNNHGKRLLIDFCVTRLGQWGVIRRWDGSFERKLSKIFAASKKDRSEFRFHINSWPSLKDFLITKGVSENEIVETREPDFIPVKASLPIVNGMDPRDYQLPIIEYMVNPGKTKLVILQTGKGKSFSTLKACSEIGQRTVFILKAMYIEQWMNQLRDTKKEKSAYGLKPGELLLIRGSQDMKRLQEQALAGTLDAKVIVISNKTMYNYIDFYETLGSVEGQYPIAPEDFFQTLKVGVRVIDELHQDFHLNFKIDLYTHCSKTIQLSATMESDKPFTNKVYGIMCPKAERYDGLAYDKYIAVSALYYQLSLPTPLKWLQRGQQSYNQIVFEESLIKRKPYLHRYLKMIQSIVHTSFVQKCVPGQKLLIFAGSVSFCSLLVNELKTHYPDLVINKYTAEDDYLKLISSDICVSTLLSSGTAVDIPGLRTVLMTTALSSQQANEQAMGRLRRIDNRWPDTIPEFLYLVCRDIPAHLRYDLQKQDIFKGKALSHRGFELPDKI